MGNYEVSEEKEGDRINHRKEWGRATTALREPAPPVALDNNNLPPDLPPDKPIDLPVPSQADQAPESTPPTTEAVKKRGRTPIPVDRKEEVAKLMADAAARDEKFPRKEAAKILYKTDKPAASQRRNAANIMKYYLKSRDKK